ncbi:inositol monophosphatase family protein [Nocardiopsis sp. CNT312]|uniref:inositol monophosphatase family protein n=1 Tax=Nocardiopsis sp. CNT312 TaxID=1137268 RepID=UPI00048BECC7|nr:inositol monophosphatase family protein [Nocardiopsis sp. CNT312]
MSTPEDLPGAMAAAVREVGALLRRWRSDAAAREGVWEGGQFKARADSLAHRALAERLTAIDAAVSVVSEEDPESLERERPSRYWLIDPIDGTASYAHGFPGYVTQAALVTDGRPEAAAVYAPETDELYTAVRGKGALRNARPLPVCDPAPPGAGVLTDNTPEPHGIAREVYEHFGYRGYLESGSISLKLCRVAEGTAHLFVKDVPVRDWDVAAPALLLEEVGGLLTRLDGTGFPYRGGYEHTGLIGAADPATGRAVAAWLFG